MSGLGDRGRVSRRLFVGLVLSGMFAVPALAGDADGYVKKVARDVMSIANSGVGPAAMKSRFNSVLSRNVDINGIALLSLGPFSKQLPAGRKNEYLGLVRNYIAAFFVYYIDDFKGADLNVKGTSQQGRFTTISSEIKFNGGSASPVKWRLVPGGGSYRVQDVNVRGVWLSLALKDRFTDILKRTKGDFAPLFDELKSADSW